MNTETPTKHAGGRPSVVTPELVEKGWDYIRKGWATDTLPNGKKVYYPMVESLARNLGISRDTIYARSEFSDIVKELKEIQLEVLGNGGISGEFNPMITKLILSSKHGYVEKTATESDNRNINAEIDASQLTEDQIRAKLDSLRQS